MSTATAPRISMQAPNLAQLHQLYDGECHEYRSRSRSAKVALRRRNMRLHPPTGFLSITLNVTDMTQPLPTRTFVRPDWLWPPWPSREDLDAEGEIPMLQAVEQRLGAGPGGGS